MSQQRVCLNMNTKGMLSLVLVVAAAATGYWMGQHNLGSGQTSAPVKAPASPAPRQLVAARQTTHPPAKETQAA